METIKTLTVGGKTYSLPQPDDTVVGADSWSSRKLIDTLCPGFTKTGAVVTCTPVEGYPLTVTAPEATKITRCGKNLVAYPYTEKTKTMNGITFTDNGDGSVTLDGTATANATFFFANRKAWCVKPGVSYVGKLHKLSGSYSGGEAPTWAVNYYPHSGNGEYLGWLWVAVGASHSYPCPNSLNAMATYLVVKTGVTCNQLVVKPQLEVGTAATDYVPYRAAEYFSPGAQIPAWEGVNMLYANVGELTVSGRTDPRVFMKEG